MIDTILFLLFVFVILSTVCYKLGYMLIGRDYEVQYVTNRSYMIGFWTGGTFWLLSYLLDLWFRVGIF